MQGQNGARLVLMFVLGFLFLQVAITGRLGSIIAAFIAPGDLAEENQPGNVNTGAGGPLPTTGTLSATQVALYAIRAGFPATATVQATAIALAESGGQIGATNKDSNGTTDYGLWQINSVHSSYDPGKLLTPAYNAQAAYNISSGGSNWNPWTTFRTGAYLAHMSDAEQGVINATLQEEPWHA